MLYTIKQKTIFLLPALILAGALLLGGCAAKEKEQSLFFFVPYELDMVRAGESTISLTSEGDVASATIHLRNLGGVTNTGGSFPVSSDSSSARYKLTYEKGMKKAEESNAGNNVQFSRTISLYMLQTAVEFLHWAQPHQQALQIQFHPAENKIVAAHPTGYDLYYIYTESRMDLVKASQLDGTDDYLTYVADGQKVYVAWQ